MRAFVRNDALYRTSDIGNYPPILFQKSQKLPLARFGAEPYRVISRNGLERG